MNKTSEPYIAPMFRLHTIPAVLLIVLESSDCIKIAFNGRSWLGQNVLLADFPTIDSPPMQVMAHWVGVAKLLIVIALLSSLFPTDFTAKIIFSVGYTVGMSTYFVRLGPAIRRAEEDGSIQSGLTRKYRWGMILLIILFGAGAADDIRRTRIQSDVDLI